MKILALGLFLLGATSCTHINNEKDRQPSEALYSSSSESPKLIHFNAACKDLSRNCFQLIYTHGSRLAIMGFLSNASVAGNGGYLSKTYQNNFMPMGFGLPFSFYDEFMKTNFTNYNENEQTLNFSSVLNEADLKEIQSKILNGEIPESFYKKTVYELEFLRKQVKFEYSDSETEEFVVNASYLTEEGQKLKSSDTGNSITFKFSATSFYDAKKPCQMIATKNPVTGNRIYNVEPKSLACAIKGAYAIHWSSDSLAQRSNFKSNAIALTIETPYNFRKDLKLKANSLLATKIFADSSSFGHQLYTQQGLIKASSKNESVVSELSLLQYDDYQRLSGVKNIRFAKPNTASSALNKSLLNEQEVKKISFIANNIEQRYCELYPELYPGAKCNVLLYNPSKENALGIRFSIFDNNMMTVDDMSVY